MDAAAVAAVLDRLHVEASGPEEAPPVLLLHGWGSHAQNMRPIADALQDAYRVLNVDLPGHGRTPPPPEAWGVPEHAALVAALLRERVGQPVTVIGHSNGGRIALYMAGDDGYADLFERLVLVSPSGVPPRRPLSYYVRKYTATTLKASFRFLPAPLREPGLDWLRHSLVWKLLGSSDYQALQGVMRETFVKTVNCYVTDRLGRIQVPTLLVWGTDDTAVSRYQMEILEREIPDAGLVVLDGAGHYGYLDDFTTFIAATRYFLDPEEAEAA